MLLSLLHNTASSSSDAGAWFLIGLFGTIVVGIFSNLILHFFRKAVARVTRHHH